MKSIVMSIMFLSLSVMTVYAQAEPKVDPCPSQLQAANNVLRTNAVTENLLESELNQKRKQTATLGLQLQEERQAHAETKKALAKLQNAAKSTEKPKE